MRLFVVLFAVLAEADVNPEVCVDCDSEDMVLLAHAHVEKHRDSCPEVDALLKDYGEKIGPTGNLFGLGEAWQEVPAFYTWKSYLSAVCQYNKMAVADHVPTFLGESETKVKAMTVVAMMANLKVETLHWTACKERVRMEDGSCPCDKDPDCKGGCSGGKINDYTSEKAKIAGFTITTCNGADAPADGCTDFWGNKVDPKNCWFGRGATQLTWPGNYQGLEAIVQKASSVDLCANPDSICDKDQMAWLTAIAYWQQNSKPWDEAHTFESSLEVIWPADKSANPQREKYYCEWLKALDISPVKPTPRPPMPDHGKTTVKSGEGCWQIADRCCDGQGKDWAKMICHPPACNPAPIAGQTIEYNCKGCP